MMMGLVLLAVAFMWVAQVFLFNQNYIHAGVREVTGKVDDLKLRLSGTDLAESPELMFFLSMAVNGKMLLADEQGNLIGAYSMGHPLDLANDRTIAAAWSSIQDSVLFSKVLAREDHVETNTYGAVSTWVTIGVPVRYDGQNAYAILNHSLSAIHAMLDVNRRQLVLLSILLTLAASVLAALMSRRFTKPIFLIRDTVDRLAKGDLSAKPGLTRLDELGQLSDAVESLGVELQRVDVLRREVIANVSHELRSPLALIAGYAEMVRDLNWKDDGKRNEDLTLIISESRRMTEMVSDIMDYSQLQAGFHPLKVELYNLCEIVENEVQNCERTARENNVRLSLEGTEGDIPVRVDALKISQVIRNLLYNAINHTQDNEEILVRVAAGETGIRVSVINPGEAIPEEERALIWERYQRSQHQGGRRQGTGIGLSIVRAILQEHGMTFGVDCRDGLTCFWFEYR